MKKSETKKKTSKATSHNAELPVELDFFKYAQGTGKRKASDKKSDKSEKRRRLDRSESEQDNEDEGSEDEESVLEENSGNRPRQRHRVTAKGSNVPEHADSFEQMHDRYRLPSHILSNLSKNGWERPTGIQSYGIPILLEVFICTCSVERSPLIPAISSLGTLLQSHRQEPGRRYHTCCQSSPR